MKKGVTFKAGDLLRAVKETRDHIRGGKKLTMRVTRVNLPAPAPELGPQDVLLIRQQLNVSQPIFARMLNVPEITAVSWEKGAATLPARRYACYSSRVGIPMCCCTPDGCPHSQ